MSEQFCTVGDVELCYETFGVPSDPAVLLFMGLGTQMIAWREEFCELLASRGFHVIRFDNRDIGRSTHMKGVKPPTPAQLLRRDARRATYDLEDMASDAAGLLECLGIEAAHVVGASMGGMIAQTLAGRHPERVLSLTSIMSTTGNRWKGQPAFKTFPFLLAKPPKDREHAAERAVKLFKVVGSPKFERDEDDLRELVYRSYERGGGDVSGTGRQLGAILASGDRTQALGNISAPTLVIHGTADKLVRSSGGKATANAIPGARLELIDGMGHDLPRDLWPRFAELIAENAARAPEATRASRAA
jgi:pimeloyl-ACP methyl ester carboxylesterase